MLFAGFFVNQNNIPKFLYPFQYISLFKYGMQAFMLNEYWGDTLEKIKIETGTDPIAEYDSPENLELSIGLIWVVGFGFYLLSFVTLMIFSKRYG